MMIAVSPAARDNIHAVHSHYTERKPDIVGRIMRVITDAIAGLAQFSLLGREDVKPGTRERIISRYPYKIVYEIHGT